MTMTTSDTYRGTAIVLTTTKELSVEADLCKEYTGGLPGWRGQLIAEPTEDYWDVLEERGGKLRLPNGQAGDFIPSRASLGSGRLDIVGSGPAPF